MVGKKKKAKTILDDVNSINIELDEVEADKVLKAKTVDDTESEVMPATVRIIKEYDKSHNVTTAWKYSFSKPLHTDIRLY